MGVAGKYPDQTGQDSFQVKKVYAAEESVTGQDHFQHHHPATGNNYPAHLPERLPPVGDVPDAKSDESRVKTVVRKGEQSGVATDESDAAAKSSPFRLAAGFVRHLL